MHRRWLSLPLLSSCVSAFYPYSTGDGGDPHSKRFFPLQLDPLPSDDTTTGLTLDLKKTPVRRDNKYSIVTSNAPSMPNAMAINQDGNDYTYFSTLRFGTSEKWMYMLIDSGSANTWVMGSNCTSPACQLHTTYGSADSTSLTVTNRSWSMVYGTGQVNGVVAQDTVRLANYTISLGFGLATVASDDFSNYPMDGILGLGRSSSDALGTPTIMKTLADQAHLSPNIVAIHLQRSSDGTKDGQITFGGLDSSKFNGKITYSKTVSDATWEIAVDDAGVDGKGVGFTGKSAMIDTGTSYILMPPADAQALHALIPGSSHNGEVYVVPCGTTAQIYFTFSGIQYSISPKDYVGRQSGNNCQSNIIGHQAFGPNDWILGAVFLKNVYTVFDFDVKQIGFGTLSGAPSSAAQNSSTSTSSSSSPSSSTTSSSSSASGSSSANSPTTSNATPLGSSTTLVTSIAPARSSTDAAAAPATAATTSSGTSDSSPFGQSSSNSPPISQASGIQIRLSTVQMLLLAFLVGLIL